MGAGGDVGRGRWGKGLSMTYIAGAGIPFKEDFKTYNCSNSCKHFFVVNRFSLSLIYGTDFRGKIPKDLE